MSFFRIHSRKVLTLVATLSIAGASVPLSTSAEAGGWCPPCKPPKWGFGGPGAGFGVGMGIGMVGGLILSQAAASEAASECTIVHRRAVDDEGNVYLQRVRVCD